MLSHPGRLWLCPDRRHGRRLVFGRRLTPQITFDSIPDYPDTWLEPAIRMLFVAAVAAVFALFLDPSLITIIIGKINLTKFVEIKGVALLVGFVAGISQKALSVQLMDRAQKALNPSG